MIRDIYTTPDLGRRAARLREAVDLGPGLEYARARAEELVATALSRLKGFPDSPSRRNLEEFGGFVLARKW